VISEQGMKIISGEKVDVLTTPHSSI